MDALILGLRVVVALGAVLGLMWFLQRRLGQGAGRRRADRALTIVGRQSLGQKASVVVVEAAGQRFLLGVTEHAVNVLHTGDIPPEPEEVPVPGISRGLGDFARILAEASPLAGNHFSSRPAGPTGDGADGPDEAADGADEPTDSGRDLPPSRRSTLHRNSHARGPAGRGGASSASGHPPLHGSILAGSTWKQAAAALRSGRRN
jgi:flagellar protein FliO/FliZ